MLSVLAGLGFLAWCLWFWFPVVWCDSMVGFGLVVCLCYVCLVVGCLMVVGYFVVLAVTGVCLLLCLLVASCSAGFLLLIAIGL